MVIKFPTALYQSILPGVEDSGNITWTVSSNDPPRPNTNPPPLQLGETSQQLPPRVNTPEERLVALGELVFAVSFGTTHEVGNGAKAFEVGELLDFDASKTTSQINNLNVPEVIDVQQNTNMLNLQGAGLTDEEAADLTAGARDKFNVIMNDLNDIRTLINDKKVTVQDTQRLLNEVQKAKNAATQVYGGTDNEIVIKLTTRQNELIQQRETLIAEINASSAHADDLYNEMIQIKEVVR